MRHIEIAILESTTYQSARRLMATAARLTQRNHSIHDMSDLMAMHERPAADSLIATLSALPHPTLQKFGTITIAIVGASRRFLAQITRHQNEVKFMSGSLQYSDMSDNAAFVIPYELLADGDGARDYLRECHKNAKQYKELIASGVNHDSAGYIMPQGMRNTLLICATPYQWKHMVSQRVCRRNTDETRIIMLRIWSLLRKLDPIVFDKIGPACTTTGCREGKMRCGARVAKDAAPDEILREDYPLLYEEYDVYPIK